MWKVSFYYIGFSLKSSLTSHVSLFFTQKYYIYSKTNIYKHQYLACSVRKWGFRDSKTLEDGLIFASSSNGYLIPSEKHNKHRIRENKEKLVWDSNNCWKDSKKSVWDSPGIPFCWNYKKKARDSIWDYNGKKKLKPSDFKWDSCSQMAIYTSLLPGCPPPLSPNSTNVKKIPNFKWFLANCSDFCIYSKKYLNFMQLLLPQCRYFLLVCSKVTIVYRSVRCIIRKHYIKFAI